MATAQILTLASAQVTEAKLDSAASNVLNALRVGRWTYDFSVLGGAVSAIPMTGAALPAKAVIVGGLLYTVTGFTGGAGCTAAISVEAANDLVLATVVAGAPFSTTGIKAIIPIFTAATMIATTQTRTPAITFAVNAATAGKINLFLQYVVTD